MSGIFIPTSARRLQQALLPDHLQEILERSGIGEKELHAAVPDRFPDRGGKQGFVPALDISGLADEARAHRIKELAVLLGEPNRERIAFARGIVDPEIGEV